jgi:hypothetical protein
MPKKFGSKWSFMKGTTFGQCGIRTHDLWLRRAQYINFYFLF